MSEYRICTCGDTLEEARAMAADAIKCVLESMRMVQFSRPRVRLRATISELQ